MLAIVAMTACGDDNIAPPTAPTPPTTVTETFSGAVTRNGAATHSFTTQASGSVVATLTAFSADEGTRVGLALGTFNGSACQLVITKDDATLASSVTGAVSALGSLCVRIYDVGNLTGPVDYEIQVSHP
jgi:hypothetical protein